MRMNRQIKIGATIVTVLIFTALAAPYLAPYHYDKLDLPSALSSPSRVHLLGQDELGRDILSRLIYGARVSVSIGILVVSLSAFVGVFLGLIAGYYGGFLDNLIMRVIDILMAFPGILLAITLTAVMGPSYFNVVFALSVLGWVGYARLVRAQVLSEREKEYVESARALGAGSLRITFRHILPNVLAPVLVQATFGLGGAILSEAGLSFLGLGIQGYPSWGAMLDAGTDYLLEAPHIATFPGVAILTVVMGFNFLGDGLRDYIDPKNKNRHSM